MSFSPVIPLPGYSGWTVFKRTEAVQKAAFMQNGQIQRDEAYFREKIGGIKTAEDLVGDRRLLSVALTAFGLQDDINNRYFIRKVLEDGTQSRDALANRLADKRYMEFSRTFGFGDPGGPRTQLSSFASAVLARYETQSFETAVGEQNDTIRLAMNAERELGAIAARPVSEDARWLTLMGSVPLRKVVEAAFNLPKGFAGLGLDQQISTLKQRAESVLGSGEMAQFTDPAQVDKLVRIFLIKSSVADGGATVPGATALTLMQGAMRPTGRLSLRL